MYCKILLAFYILKVVIVKFLINFIIIIKNYYYYRVHMGPEKPGKSWNFIMAFSRTGKFWKKATGPGKFWKSVKLH